MWPFVAGFTHCAPNVRSPVFNLVTDSARPCNRYDFTMFVCALLTFTSLTSNMSSYNDSTFELNLTTKHFSVLSVFSIDIVLCWGIMSQTLFYMFNNWHWSQFFLPNNKPRSA